MGWWWRGKVGGWWWGGRLGGGGGGGRLGGGSGGEVRQGSQVSGRSKKKDFKVPKTGPI